MHHEGNAADRERRNRERRERIAAGADALREAIGIAGELLDDGRKDEALELLQEYIAPALEERAAALRRREEGQR